MRGIESVAGGAGSPALRALLAGPPATGTVVHAGPQAVYADLGGAVVGVVARGAVHVPCAVATTLTDLPDVAAGDEVTAGDGVLRVGPLGVAATRLVSFTVPRTPAAVLPDVTAELSTARDQLPAEALARLAAGDPAAVPALVGRGDGLTPVGDDVLAGWLVAAHAAGRDDAAVAAAVLAHLPRTTGLSAALLRHAVAGEAIAPFRAVLVRADAAAVAALLAVGHSSGAGMLLGAHLALSSSITHEALEGSTR
ncbi:oxamate carbamoyltransferase subunit AllH family protein [Pimelobacter simplex]|uniref:oxamate carbamoyltransferase subunit AllH family protein n=1 Tax=Nocardioides simplex TaxID=2045 RepID=UPI001931FAA2